MIPKMKRSGQTSAGAANVLWGAGISLVLTIVLSMVTAWLMASEKLKEENMGYAVMVLLLMASYIGGYVGCRTSEGKRLLVAMLTGAAYMGILLGIGVVFYGGVVSAVGETLLLVLCGNVLAAMWSSRKKNTFQRRKLKIPNR